MWKCKQRKGVECDSQVGRTCQGCFTSYFFLFCKYILNLQYVIFYTSFIEIFTYHTIHPLKCVQFSYFQYIHRLSADFTMINSRTFSSVYIETLYTHQHLLPISPQLQATHNLLSATIGLPILDISYKWDCARCGPL